MNTLTKEQLAKIGVHLYDCIEFGRLKSDRNEVSVAVWTINQTAASVQIKDGVCEKVTFYWRKTEPH